MARQMRGWVIASTVIVLTVSCASQHHTPSTSRTPRITVATGTKLDAALLTAADLQSVPALGASASTRALNDLNVYKDPDPRAPCGAKITAPDLSSGAGVGIQAPGVQGVELVVRLTDVAAKAYLDAMVADAHQGCPAYQTTTNTGATQTVTLRQIFPLPALADGALAAGLTVTSGSAGAAVTLIVVRRATTIALTTLFATTAPPDDTVRALATRIAGGLARAG